MTIPVLTPLHEQGHHAKAAARALALAGTDQKNTALAAIADALEAHSAEILAQNQIDCTIAQESGLRASLLDRLRLDETRVRAIARGVRDVMALDDPIGRMSDVQTRPNGLVIGRKTVPLGVVAVIYEARPNVTVDTAALCLKAGNAVLLRGGKEAFRTNCVFCRLMQDAVERAGLPRESIQLVADTSRDSATELMGMTDCIDVLIPRGGKGLIEQVVQTARVPVIETGWGNCHVYVEQTADLEMAANIIANAKCSRPSVCNAAETLLVDRAVAATFLPLAQKQLDAYHCRLRGCAETCAILPNIEPATEEDWDTEYGDYILAVKVVSNSDEALRHIARHSSGHSECIVTRDYFSAERFLNEVDAAAVYVNASTRFTDGGEFGLGAELGISTQKLHARGPMGLQQLTSTKFIVRGTGQIR